MANETAIAIEKARLNEELKSSKDFLNSVLEGIGEGVIVLDKDFRIVAANSAYINQEKPEGEVIGKHCYSISHRFEKACHELGHECPVLKTFETGKYASGIHTHYDSKGKASYVEVHSYPLKDSADNITMVVETITDVTERYELEKRLVESEERYRDLYDNAPDMYFSISGDLILLDCNNTMAQNLGYKKNELIGNHVSFFTMTPQEELNRKINTIKLTGSLVNTEARWRMKSGEIIDVILNITAFYNEAGDFIFARVSARDITDKKVIETELKKKVNDLEDFYKMAVDREMKMVELKKEIERLRGKSV
ncbi:MAG: PAS domain S-box protein [Nitrospirae bacterium]|nr:PAS domain S-box protein [Nitrospirota bacterium]